MSFPKSKRFEEIKCKYGSTLGGYYLLGCVYFATGFSDPSSRRLPRRSITALPGVGASSGRETTRGAP